MIDKFLLRELHRHHEELDRNADDEIDDDTQQQFIDMIDKFLTQQQKVELDSNVALDELSWAIKHSERNKSPSSDGLTIEFYEEFEDVLGPNMVKLFNHIYSSSTQPISQKIGYMKLTHKKNEVEFLRNWRSITLLNVDHKLLTKIISHRLRSVLPDIICEDQTCGIPGREIFDNAYLIRDVIQVFLHFSLFSCSFQDIVDEIS